MRRDLSRLAGAEFDLLVVGAGIYGAALAWDAAQRGLSVALVDRGDFGGATSFNNHKTVHGGLRSLQQGNLPQMREFIRERPEYKTARDDVRRFQEALAARERKESRGAHARADFQEKDKTWGTFNLVIKKGRDGNMEIRREPIAAIRQAYRVLLQSRLNTTEALARLELETQPPEVTALVDFIRTARRGVILKRGRRHGADEPAKRAAPLQRRIEEKIADSDYRCYPGADEIDASS